MNFQIDFGNFIQPVATANAPLYASVDGVAHPLGGDECVFQDRATGEVHAMTVQVLQALDMTREFRTLDEHCAAIAQRLGGLAGQADAVRRVIDGLIQRGLVISDAQYLARLAVPSERTPAPLRAVFIRGGGGAGALDRLLDSLAVGEAKSRARRRYVALDGDAAALRRFASATGAVVTHVDAAARRALAERLATAVPHAAAALRRAIGADAAGAGTLHNVAALLGAGARYALLDATAVLPLARAHDAQPGLDLVGAPGVPLTLFPSADAALAAGTPLARDPFDVHLELAGHALGNVLALPDYAPTRASLRGTAPSRAARLAPTSRVAATSVGHRGQTATTRVGNLFMLDADASAQLWRDRAQYQRHLDGACVWRGVARARLIEPEQARPFLIDASVPVAPLIDGLRSADLLFGVMTRALDADSVQLMTPDTLGRDDGGAHDPLALQRAERPALAEFVADFVGARFGDVRAEQPAARARTVAGWLADAAAASQATRTEMLDEFVRFRRSDVVARLQAAVADAQGAPDYWLADANALIMANGKALIDGEPSRLHGWPDELDAGACAARFGAELADYAELLAVWPELHATATEQGEHLLDA